MNILEQQIVINVAGNCLVKIHFVKKTTFLLWAFYIFFAMGRHTDIYIFDQNLYRLIFLWLLLKFCNWPSNYGIIIT
jgi:hypothetical protein